MNTTTEAIENLVVPERTRKNGGNNRRFYENVFAVCMFSAAVACIWHSVSMVISFVTHFN